jgi:hypothetical protein
MICSSFTRVLTYTMKFYSFLESKYISEESHPKEFFIDHTICNTYDEFVFFLHSKHISVWNQDDLFIIHESSSTYDQILFFSL